jgi:hypothetical protein
MEFPINVTVPDPVSGRDFTFHTDNIMDSLRIDRGALQGDAAVVAGQYAEIARVGRACSAAGERAKTSYAKWKAEKATHFRKAKDAAGVKTTEKEIEASYRSDPAYEHHAGLATYYANLAALFDDLREAFAIKARMMARVTEAQSGQDRTDANSQRVGHAVEDNGESIEDLEAFAAASVAESRAAASPTPPPANVPAPPRGLDEDTEDEDEDTEDEDDDDDGDAPIAPPKKRARAPKAVAQAPAKKGRK